MVVFSFLRMQYSISGFHLLSHTSMTTPVTDPICVGNRGGRKIRGKCEKKMLTQKHERVGH